MQHPAGVGGDENVTCSVHCREGCDTLRLLLVQFAAVKDVIP